METATAVTESCCQYVSGWIWLKGSRTGPVVRPPVMAPAGGQFVVVASDLLAVFARCRHCRGGAPQLPELSERRWSPAPTPVSCGRRARAI